MSSKASYTKLNFNNLTPNIGGLFSKTLTHLKEAFLCQHLMIKIKEHFLTAVLFVKRRLLKIAKSPGLSTGGNDNSKSRYGNDLKFVMAL